MYGYEENTPGGKKEFENLKRTIWVSRLDMVFADAATMTNPVSSCTQTRSTTRNFNSGKP
jgi:hypothetical protein